MEKSQSDNLFINTSGAVVPSSTKTAGIFSLVVIASALGYFVDIFDLFLFGVVRTSSLKDLGVGSDRLLDVGIILLDCQMLGVLLGGIFWGVMGDKYGRVSVLFGSIFIYSLANLANGFVDTVNSYVFLRFIAGFGLAGELGLAVTLVSESLPQKSRGYGTTIVTSLGLCGSIAAAVVTHYFYWRTSFFIGGVLGLFLLFLRLKLRESLFYSSLKNNTISRGNFFMIFTNKARLKKYVHLILIGVPIWFAIGVVVTFSPEVANALGVSGPIIVGDAIFYTYIGVAIGDLVSGLWSQYAKCRRNVIAIFIVLMTVFLFVCLFSTKVSARYFYTELALLGFATGYWAVFMTTAAEQFGTNLRATVTTTVPNFVRGSVVPVTIALGFLKSYLNLIPSIMFIGFVCVILALWSLYQLEESYEKTLDFIE